MRIKTKKLSFWTRLAIFAAMLVVVCLILLMILAPKETDDGMADFSEAYSISDYDLQSRVRNPAMDNADICKIMKLEEYSAFCKSHSFQQRYTGEGSYAVYAHIEQEFSVLSTFLQKALYDPMTKTLNIHFVENYAADVTTPTALLCVVPVPDEAREVKITPLYQQAFEDDGTRP